MKIMKTSRPLFQSPFHGPKGLVASLPPIYVSQERRAQEIRHWAGPNSCKKENIEYNQLSLLTAVNRHCRGDSCDCVLSHALAKAGQQVLEGLASSLMHTSCLEQEMAHSLHVMSFI